jgi:hypothetical protein
MCEVNSILYPFLIILFVLVMIVRMIHKYVL